MRVDASTVIEKDYNTKGREGTLKILCTFVLDKLGTSCERDVKKTRPPPNGRKHAYNENDMI